jgi:hypothetical protein
MFETVFNSSESCITELSSTSGGLARLPLEVRLRQHLGD